MYDGSFKWDRITAELNRAGYYCRFSCAYFDTVPEELRWTGLETGWELRRKLKNYCTSNGIENYKIVRNESYHRDLHGRAVYELWTKEKRGGN